MSALDDTEDESEDGGGELSPQSPGSEQIPSSRIDRQSSFSLEAATRLGRRMSDAVLATTPDTLSPTSEESIKNLDSSEQTDQPPEEEQTTHFASNGDLVSQLYTNPKFTALRSSMGRGFSPMSPTFPKPPPILVNPKCSGYFTEPMQWMEPFLESGQLAGKILCPNKKCGAKLGNYDWAGMCCGCKQWVTPGFCINRSKVDEVV